MTKCEIGDSSQLHSHANSFWSGVYYYGEKYDESSSLAFENPLTNYIKDYGFRVHPEVLTQSESPVDFETTKIQEGFLSKMFSLLNKNPNYKMLGALGMMLVNFSVCVTIANWLKHSSLVS